ncbi:MAG: hypothetical protein DWQ06_01080 [Calditrichaeota bacterium]|nr:MAG: hypothetical protein DWQ06_01080 [Calditrichota bacterium]
MLLNSRITFFSFLTISLLSLFQNSFAQESIFEVRDLDKIIYTNEQEEIFDLQIYFWDKNWKLKYPKDVIQNYSNGKIQFKGGFILKPKVSELPFALEVSRNKKNSVKVNLSLNVIHKLETKGMAFVFKIPTDFLCGKNFRVSNSSKTKLPFYPDTKIYFEDRAGEFEVESFFKIKTSKNQNFTVTDRRLSGKSALEVRVWVPESNFEFGKHKISLEIEFLKPTNFSLNPDSKGKNFITSDWLENPLPWDSFPIDLSFLNHKPAGKFGFLQTKGENFVFEGNKKIKFFGVNLSGEQCFPEKEEAEILAKRLAKMGVNLVRIHHLNVKWSSKRLFYSDEKGYLKSDAVNWLKLDYLFYCLKEEGIYIQLDLLVDPDHLWNKPKGIKTWKGFTHFVPDLIEKQKLYAQTLWEHKNTYTNLDYKDDPVFAFTTVTNENDITTHNVIARRTRYDIEPYISQFEKIKSIWADRKGVMEFQMSNLWRDEKGKEFLNDVQANYFYDIKTYIKTLGVKIPVTGTNWVIYQKDLPSMAKMDFMDTHTYGSSKLDVNPSLGNPVLSASFARIKDKPFVISEYGPDWQGKWRSVLPIQMASIGSLQNWSALILYAYRQNGTGEISSLKGAYNLLIDPQTTAVLPISALIFRREDLAQAQRELVLNWDYDTLYGDEKWKPSATPFFNTATEQFKISGVIEGEKGLTPTDRFENYEGVISSDTKEYFRDFEKGLLYLNSPRTQGVVGNLAKQKDVKCDFVKFDTKSKFGSIFVSSLEKKPINESKNIFVSAIGKAENEGTKWNLGETQIVKKSKGTVFAEPLTSKIEITHINSKNLKVLALRKDGFSEVKDVTRNSGSIIFEINPENKALFYLVKE